MIQFNNQELQVSGKIDADNAQSYYLDGLRVIQSQDKFPVVVNLAGLEQGVLWLWRFWCAGCAKLHKHEDYSLKRFLKNDEDHSGLSFAG